MYQLYGLSATEIAIVEGVNIPASEIIFYQTEDGQTKLDVCLEDETVWLTQQQLATLLQTSKQNISLRIQNIYDEGELDRKATVKESLTVQTEGTRQGGVVRCPRRV